jgi:hypothetical protein
MRAIFDEIRADNDSYFRHVPFGLPPASDLP